jgi:hypothetical protein
MTTQSEIRTSFWAAFPEYQPQFKAIPYTQNGKRLYRRKVQNEYSATVRSMFVEYVDHLQRNGDISEALAGRATL